MIDADSNGGSTLLDEWLPFSYLTLHMETEHRCVAVYLNVEFLSVSTAAGERELVKAWRSCQLPYLIANHLGSPLPCHTRKESG